MIEVIDNFLPQSQFDFLQTEMMSDRFSWYFNDYEVDDTDKRYYQYTHILFDDGDESGAFILMDPIIKKLKIKNNEITRSYFVEKFLACIKKNQKIISSTGYLSREVYKKIEIKNLKINPFYMVGGMGHTSGVALGFSLAKKSWDLLCKQICYL